jgi:hypothetical protein
MTARVAALRATARSLARAAVTIRQAATPPV